MYQENDKLYMIERLVSCLTYPTMGLIGFVWILIGQFTRSAPTKFTAYHCYLSIFLSLGYVICNYIFWFLYNMITHIPFINRLVAQLVYLFNMPLVLGYSFMQVLIYGTIIYLAVTAFMGKYSYLPWFSDIIKSIVRK